MTRRVWLLAEALAVALVVALLALLIWRVVHGNGGSVSGALSHGRHPQAPVAFIGVDSKDYGPDARTWERRHGITYPSVHDGSGAVLNRWEGRTLLPSIFFVDRHGKVVGQLEVEEDLPRFLRQIATSS